MHWIPCVVGLAVVLLVGPGLAAAPATDTSDVAPTDSGAVNGYRYAKQRPVGFERVTIGPGFIQRVRDRSREVGTLDYLQKFEQAHYIDFFRWVNTDPPRRHGAGSNNDEFVHKLLEAMGVYAAESDLIARQHKELSDTILAAQAEDGYLNTYYDNPIVHSEGKRRFQSENRFEFYNFGHYAQAAIAHYRATGDRRLLDSAIGFADLIVERFANPNDLPYRKWKDRVNLKYEHPNHELAMVDLYRWTGDRRYLAFARQTYEEYEFFGPKFDEIWGHAVQETLLYAGAADLYLETGADDVWTTVRRLWNDMYHRKRFITGGVGSQAHGESYGAAYYLPHETCYQETCAGMSLVFWNHKMLLATGDTVYADEMERSLYNNVLGGISLDGTHYFYQQRLRTDGRSRQPFFSCSCCPPNVHRLLAAIGDYIYTQTEDELRVNLFVGSTVEHPVGCQTLRLTQQTDYPHGDTVELTVVGVSDAETTLSLRIPAWAAEATVRLNGAKQPNPEPGRYYTLHRVWNDGDTIQLDLAMTPRIIQPNRKVDAQQGRLAMMLGPMVYCVEAPDNPGVALRHLSVSNEVAPAVTLEKDLLGGVNVLTFSGWEWTADRTSREVTVRAIPYYTRANRKIGYMNVWLATDEQLAIAPPQPGPSPKPVAPVPITKPR